jgi:hypothetical protein
MGAGLIEMGAGLIEMGAGPTEMGAGVADGTGLPISPVFQPTDPFAIQLLTFITFDPLSITVRSSITAPSYIAIARW